MASQKAVDRAHAAAGKRAMQARVAALKLASKPPRAPEAESTATAWARLMQASADATAAAKRSESCASWLAAVDAAAAVRRAAGEDGAAVDAAEVSCDDAACASCAPGGGPTWKFAPRGFSAPPPPPPAAAEDAPSAEATADARAFGRAAHRSARYGLGAARLRDGDAPGASRVLGDLLVDAGADEAKWRTAWEARADAFSEMNARDDDAGTALLVELHLEKASKAEPADADLAERLAQLSRVNDARAARAVDGRSGARPLAAAAAPDRAFPSLKAAATTAASESAAGDALYREGLWRSAASHYAAALSALAAVPAGPTVAAAAAAARLNLAGCLLRAPGDADAVADEVAAHCAAALAADPTHGPTRARAYLRRATARERAGAYDAAIADLGAAKALLGADAHALVDARVDHAAFLRRTRCDPAAAAARN